jgi:hypothetical protein
MQCGRTVLYSTFGKLLCTYKRQWKWCPRTTVSKNWIKQSHTLPALHFNRWLTTEYSETTAHFNDNPMKTDDHSRALLNVSFGASSKVAHPTGHPHWASSERDATFLQPPTSTSQSPGRTASFQVPHRAPTATDAVSRAFLPILQDLQQVSRPSRFPAHNSHRGRRPIPTTTFIHLTKSPVYEPTLGCPAEPHVESCLSPGHSFHKPWSPVKETSLFNP